MEWNPFPLHLKGVKTVSPHLIKVWKPYFPTFTMCGNLIPLIYSGWKPYSPTFTRCGNLIHPNLQGVET